MEPLISRGGDGREETKMQILVQSLHAEIKSHSISSTSFPFSLSDGLLVHVNGSIRRVRNTKFASPFVKKKKKEVANAGDDERATLDCCAHFCRIINLGKSEEKQRQEESEDSSRQRVKTKVKSHCSTCSGAGGAGWLAAW